MDMKNFGFVPTCEVPLPIVEPPDGKQREEAGPLPRILLQAAGSGAHERRLLALTALFLAVVVFEATLLALLPGRAPLVVYDLVDRPPLVGEDLR